MWEPSKEGQDERMKRRCEELERHLCTRKIFDAFASTAKCKPPVELAASRRACITLLGSHPSLI